MVKSASRIIFNLFEKMLNTYTYWGIKKWWQKPPRYHVPPLYEQLPILFIIEKFSAA